MADYGTRKISLIKFQNMAANNSCKPKNPRYNMIAKQLIVCRYNDGNQEGSGVMDLYSIPRLMGRL
jgi:hypothetical protein